MQYELDKEVHRPKETEAAALWDSLSDSTKEGNKEI